MVQRPKSYTKVKSDFGQPSSGSPFWPSFSNRNELVDHPIVNTATHTYANYPNDPLMPDLEDAGIFDDAYDNRDEGAKADYNNLEIVISVSHIPSTRIHKDHPKEHIIGERRTNHKIFKIVYLLVEAMQEELLRFKLLNVWTLVNLPPGKRAIGTKWVYRNKRDQKGIIVRNKARLVAQGQTRRSVFLYGTIEEEVYVSQAPGFVDPEFPNRVYKVEKALYGLHQAPRAWSLSIEFEQLMHKRFQMSSIGELTFFLGLQVDQQKDGIFLSQDKYVSDILKKFGFSSVKSASTPMETHKLLSKDANGTNVDVHLYRSMIGSLLYLTSSMPDIMFIVCACLRFQVQPKISHMHAVKRTFRYLKGQPALGLWYPKDSPLELIAYSDSDYAVPVLIENLQQKVTKIHMDNESEICVVKNHVYHSKTKHLEIRHHFIRDSYEKRLIEMVKIHTDYNVADLFTKAFDVTRF
nr:retrotransposon protein, putative, unclassified [Tanacetum cinerariifolium]